MFPFLPIAGWQDWFPPYSVHRAEFLYFIDTDPVYNFLPKRSASPQALSIKATLLGGTPRALCALCPMDQHNPPSFKHKVGPGLLLRPSVCGPYTYVHLDSSYLPLKTLGNAILFCPLSLTPLRGRVCSGGNTAHAAGLAHVCGGVGGAVITY